MKTKFTSIQQSKLGQLLAQFENRLEIIDKKIKALPEKTPADCHAERQIQSIRYFIEIGRYHLSYFDQGETIGVFNLLSISANFLNHYFDISTFTIKPDFREHLDYLMGDSLNFFFKEAIKKEFDNKINQIKDKKIKDESFDTFKDEITTTLVNLNEEIQSPHYHRLRLKVDYFFYYLENALENGDSLAYYTYHNFAYDVSVAELSIQMEQGGSFNIPGFRITNPWIYELVQELALLIQNLPELDHLLSFFNKKALDKEFDLTSFSIPAKFSIRHQEDFKYRYTEENFTLNLDLEQLYYENFIVIKEEIHNLFQNYLDLYKDTPHVRTIQNAFDVLDAEEKLQENDKSTYTKRHTELASIPRTAAFNDSLKIYNAKIKEITKTQQELQSLIQSLPTRKNEYQNLPTLIFNGLSTAWDKFRGFFAMSPFFPTKLTQFILVQYIQHGGLLNKTTLKELRPADFLTEKLAVHAQTMSDQLDQFHKLKEHYAQKISKSHELEANRIIETCQKLMLQFVPLEQFELPKLNPNDTFEKRFKTIEKNLTQLSVNYPEDALLAFDDLAQSFESAQNQAKGSDKQYYSQCEEDVSKLDALIQKIRKHFNALKREQHHLIKETELAKTLSESGLDKLKEENEKLLKELASLNADIQEREQAHQAKGEFHYDFTKKQRLEDLKNFKWAMINKSLNDSQEKLYPILGIEIPKAPIQVATLEKMEDYQADFSKRLKSIELNPRKINHQWNTICTARDCLTQDEIPFHTYNECFASMGYVKGEGDFLTVTATEWDAYHEIQESSFITEGTKALADLGKTLLGFVNRESKTPPSFTTNTYNNTYKKQIVSNIVNKLFACCLTNQANLNTIAELKKLDEELSPHHNEIIRLNTEIADIDAAYNKEKATFDKERAETFANIDLKKQDQQKLALKQQHLQKVIDLLESNEALSTSINALDRIIPEDFETFYQNRHTIHQNIEQAENDLTRLLTTMGYMKKGNDFAANMKVVEASVTQYQEIIGNVKAKFDKKYLEELNRKHTIIADNLKLLDGHFDQVKLAKTGQDALTLKDKLFGDERRLLEKHHRENKALLSDFLEITKRKTHPEADGVIEETETLLVKTQIAWNDHIASTLQLIIPTYRGFREHGFLTNKTRKDQTNNSLVITYVQNQLNDDKQLIQALASPVLMPLSKHEKLKESESVASECIDTMNSERKNTEQFYAHKAKKNQKRLNEIQTREDLVDGIELALDNYIQQRAKRFSLRDKFSAKQKKLREAFVDDLKQALTKAKQDGNFQPAIVLIKQGQTQFSGRFLPPLLQRIYFSIEDFPLSDYEIPDQEQISDDSLENLDCLFEKIDNLKNRGSEIKQTHDKEGTEVEKLAHELKYTAHKFFKDVHGDLEAFKTSFKARLHSHDDQLSTPRGRHALFGRTSRMGDIHAIDNAIDKILTKKIEL